MLAVMNWINCSPEKTRKSDFRAQQIKTPATYLLAFFADLQESVRCKALFIYNPNKPSHFFLLKIHRSDSGIN